MQIIRKALTTPAGIVSYRVVQEFFDATLRRFAQPMNPPEAEQHFRTVFHPLLGVHSSQVLHAEALHLHAQRGLS